MCSCNPVCWERWSLMKTNGVPTSAAENHVRRLLAVPYLPTSLLFKTGFIAQPGRHRRLMNFILYLLY